MGVDHNWSMRLHAAGLTEAVTRVAEHLEAREVARALPGAVRVVEAHHERARRFHELAEEMEESAPDLSGVPLCLHGLVERGHAARVEQMRRQARAEGARAELHGRRVQRLSGFLTQRVERILGDDLDDA